jgi:hypothetical protein
MGLRQTISQWIVTIKDALDFGPEFPAVMTDRRVKFTEELTKLQHLLDQTQQAAREKDELIAKLQAAGAVQGNMVVDESAYYVKKESTLDGPFCTSCFEQNHEIARIVPAPRPEGADGDSAAWVQCGRCQTPFRSERIGQYLHPRKAAATQIAVSPEATDEAKPVKAARKPRSQTRQPKTRQPEQAKATPRRRAAR